MGASTYAPGVPILEGSIFPRSTHLLYRIVTIHLRVLTRNRSTQPWACLTHQNWSKWTWKCIKAESTLRDKDLYVSTNVNWLNIIWSRYLRAWSHKNLFSGVCKHNRDRTNLLIHSTSGFRFSLPGSHKCHLSLQLSQRCHFCGSFPEEFKY